MKQPIQIMLVEDHPEYRESLTLALNRETDMQVADQFGTAEQALRHLQSLPRAEQPDLVLLDLNLPGMSGLKALPWLQQYAPDVKTIILSQSNQEADVLAAISAGAAGYLLKGAKPQVISTAVRDVMAGDAPLDPSVAKFILNMMKTALPKEPVKISLSDREIKTLVLLSEGLLKKEIANRLGVTPHTVATFIKRIYEKLNVANAPAAVNRAYKTGILPLE
ncbi:MULTISPECIES: response regulator transcription factor [unclassified Lentimonas]|uniref:response regulator transcription factor n=1 Tax=unclassified Lentimonas TaxID=2630993 RepID=UPI00132B42C5|nr:MULTISPECIES: response regulator transcription factor [unclassified Lentimonas]CAA6677639.1 Nitrate/nitrite response regulator protein [Lentimonas sp. CC4]CAA6684902.1 Nitrate/nitrite response regulator protein [Lentimonas sp. CC6]CAA7077985.1 Nitrate/nitrite response regulator protein [Lentimonas sp. CC4]CAA7169906.1 Nitrate/nitrite response regulator protein [Lentimonas sp. CC21]CAA7180144.1 Nitrate/nitrite response regulator protein [Lentimonas sp. CC8]